MKTTHCKYNLAQNKKKNLGFFFFFDTLKDKTFYKTEAKMIKGGAGLLLPAICFTLN